MINKQRDLTIDIVKAICIIFMVAGHTTAPFGQFYGLFHMACFFMVSGYFFKESKVSDLTRLKSYFFNKIKKLWLPYFLFVSCCVLLHNIFIKLNIYTDNEEILTLGLLNKTREYWSCRFIIYKLVLAFFLLAQEGLSGPFWFVAVLFYIEMIYAIIYFILLKLLSKSSPVIYLNSIISLLFFYIGLKVSSDNIGKALCYYSLYHTGSILNIVHKKMNTKQVLIIGLISFLILLDLINMNIGINLAAKTIPNFLFLLLSSISGFFFCYSISCILKKIFFLRTCLSYIGQHTLEIVAFHLFAFKIINYLQIRIFNLPDFYLAAYPVLFYENFWWICYLITGITIPLILSFLYYSLKKIIVIRISNSKSTSESDNLQN